MFFLEKINGSIETATLLMNDIEKILVSTFDFLITECKLVAQRFKTKNQEIVFNRFEKASKKIKETPKMNSEHKVQTL